MELRLIPSTRSTRSRRAASSRRARRVWTLFGVVAAVVAAGVAAWHAPAGPLAQDSESRRIASAGLSELSRLLASPPRQRLIVFSSAGAILLSIPIAALVRRRRQQARRCALIAVEQQARAPQILEASLRSRPLRRATQLDAATQRGDDRLPEVAPLPPEVAARAAELQAEVVREAATRALILRAASERSETRRRAAALRARARRDKAAQGPAPEAAAARVETSVGPRATAPSQSQRPTQPGSTPPPRTLPKPAAVEAVRRQAPEVSPPPIAAPRRIEPPSRPQAAKQCIARVAIVRSSEPLTFEWLEQCLARDPNDIQARLDLCTALLVGERFADAERVAREGLERDAGNGRLLLRRSEALSGLDRIDEALDDAVRAVRAHRSRKAILHLTRLSAVARRFSQGDGARLRKALESRPNDPVFLYALGAFEAQCGNPREALPILRLALRQERSPRWRRVVAREIAQLRTEERAASGGRERRAAS